jgi:transglutaminase-like putative cysteine protease
MLLHIVHRTTFVYAGNACDSFNEARLRPVDEVTQVCRNFNLRIDPPVPLREYRDLYGNAVHHFDVLGTHERLVVESESEVETVPSASRRPIPIVASVGVPDLPEVEMVSEFLAYSHHVPLAAELWREAQDALDGRRADLWSDVTRIGEYVHRAFKYKPAATKVETSALEALRLRAGVCQDFAHVMLGMCRTIGLPTRYVSGYFLNADRRPDEIEASHAWIEAYIPGHGWSGYDPTHGRAADDRYVKIAVGRDYADIRPVSGVYRGAPTRELNVAVRVSRIG